MHALPGQDDMLVAEPSEHLGRKQAILASVQDGTTRILSTPGSWRMFFSPDGRYLALDRPLAGWTDQRDVFVLSVDGEEEVNVTEYPSNDRVMGWSPDSSSVLFASDRSDATGLYAVPIVDGRRQGSPTLLRSALGAAAPMGVSRSGALYYHVRSGGAAWFLQSIECSGARCAGSPVTLGPVNSMGFAWSPDGGHLAYLSPGTFRAAEPTLRIRSVGGTSIREVSATELPLGGSVTMSWAPDGRTIAVGTMMGGRLSLLNVEGQRAEVTWSGRVGVTANLAWSPDQQKLYYRLDRTGPDGNSVLMERDVRSQTERELLRRQGGAAIGGWALRRDGQSIFAMVNDTAAQTSELLAIPIAGGEPQTIARRPAMGGVNVSPDGRYIATISRIASEKTTAILLIPVAGGEIRELFRVAQPAAVRDLMWTPDSQSLYFRKGPSTVGARGRGANATADTRAELWRVPIDGSEARAVEAAIDMDMRLPVALSPDGRRLAFIRSDGGGPVKSEVWKLENFLPAAAGRR